MLMVDEYATIATPAQALVCDNRLCDNRAYGVQWGMDRNIVLAWMTRRNLNNRQVAELLNISEDKVSKSLADKGKPRRWQGDEVMRLIELMRDDDASATVLSEVRSAGIESPDAVKYGSQPLKPMPLLGSALGGEWDGLDAAVEMIELQLGEVLDYVRRPTSLRNDPAAYALTVLGSSMHPRFKPGCRIIVSPRAPVAIGDDVVVQLYGDADSEGDVRVVRVLVKELVKRTSDTVTLRQYNPATDFEVPTKRVAHTHKVIGEIY